MDMLEAKLRDLASADLFSGGILLGNREGILLERAFGDACKSFAIKNEVDTKHNIASLGKMFTGVAVAQLAEGKKLAFEDKLSDYIDPSILSTDISSKVQLRHLLTHTSGFGDYFSYAYAQSYRKEYRELEDFIPIIRESTMQFEPGTQ